MSHNTKPYCASPVEVPVREMRSGSIVDKIKHDFWREVALRLEQTKPQFAVRYEFADADDAAAYQRYVMQMMRKGHGKGFVQSSKRRAEQDGVWYVYFARGPNWKA